MYFELALTAYTSQSPVLSLSEGVSTECNEEEVKSLNEVCSAYKIRLKSSPKQETDVES